MRLFFIVCIFAFLAMPPALQAATPLPEPTPAERLESLPPALREEARTLWTRLRCMVCEGQSVAQSQAPLARDIRQRVLLQLQAGRHGAEIESDLAQRYGDAILLSPPKRGESLVLWLLPGLFLLGGLVMLVRRVRRHPAPRP